MRKTTLCVLLVALLLSPCGTPAPVLIPASAGQVEAAITTLAPAATGPSPRRQTDFTPQVASGAEIPLPAPRKTGRVSVEEALAQRRSVRAFSAVPLTLSELGQLLWAAQGITNERGFRTAPSAGALYPLEVYAVTGRATYRYKPDGHGLVVHMAGDRRPALHQAALQQGPVLDAPLVVVIAAVYERTLVKYGAERTPRYVHMEAGHAGQNILLQSVALGLGAVPIGAFYDDQVHKILALPVDQQPLYIIAVGRGK